MWYCYKSFRISWGMLESFFSRRQLVLKVSGDGCRGGVNFFLTLKSHKIRFFQHLNNSLKTIFNFCEQKEICFLLLILCLKQHKNSFCLRHRSYFKPSAQYHNVLNGLSKWKFEVFTGKPEVSWFLRFWGTFKKNIMITCICSWRPPGGNSYLKGVNLLGKSNKKSNEMFLLHRTFTQDQFSCRCLTQNIPSDIDFWHTF